MKRCSIRLICYLTLLNSVLILITIISCKPTIRPAKDLKDTRESHPVQQIKPSSSYQDSLSIDARSTVFYQPDSLQLERIKSVTDPGIFEGSMHEYFFQQRNAQIEIKRDYPDLKIIHSQNVRFLVFRKNNNTSEVIDLNKFNDAYGLFIFDPDSIPVLVDMTNLGSAIYPYFYKK